MNNIIHEGKKESPDDDYGWWKLNEGDYVVEYNETLTPADGAKVHFQVWPPALHNGLAHPSEVVAAMRDPLRTILRVPSSGVAIKENARISMVTTL